MLTVVALTLWSCVHKWPHYKASAPGAYVTGKLGLMRLTLGERVHLPIADRAELTAVSVCYPPKPDGYQPCHLVTDLRIQQPMNISFVAAPFVVRDPSNHDIRYVTGLSIHDTVDCTAERIAELDWCTAATAIIHLAYEMPPRRFELLVPGVNIDDHTVAVPPITFEYDDFLAYQLVPWIVNF